MYFMRVKQQTSYFFAEQIDLSYTAVHVLRSMQLYAMELESVSVHAHTHLQFRFR